MNEILIDRIERLLERHQEQRRTIELLEVQVECLSHERDAMQARLNAASTRLEAVLSRLPLIPNDDQAGVL